MTILLILLVWVSTSLTLGALWTGACAYYDKRNNK